VKKLSIIFLFLSIRCFSQIDSIAYSREFEFKEGLFLNFEQFKKNDPIPKSAIVSSYPQTQVDFLSQVLASKYVTYKGADGSEHKVEPMSLWGYCQNRSIYINFKDDFNRVNVIGNLCLFSAVISVPMSYHDPMNNYGINTQDDIRQFILNTNTDKIVDFNVFNMEMILKNDQELYSEFMKMKKRKKSDSIFIYIRKYNEKHPLFLSAK
jgi:hypothetical protein